MRTVTARLGGDEPLSSVLHQVLRDFLVFMVRKACREFQDLQVSWTRQVTTNTFSRLSNCPQVPPDLRAPTGLKVRLRKRLLV